MGPLDERFPLHMADQAYCLKIKQAGKRIYLIVHAEVIHYGSQSINQRSREEILAQHMESHTFYDVFYAPSHPRWLRPFIHFGIDCRMLFKLTENALSRDKRVIKGPGAPQSRHRLKQR